MKKKLIVFACFLLVSLSCLPQLPVRLNERSVVLNTSTGALKGKMVTPNQESGYPVVLIIPGSGPTDMDGNSAALPGKNNSLKYLAEGLAGKVSLPCGMINGVSPPAPQRERMSIPCVSRTGSRTHEAGSII